MEALSILLCVLILGLVAYGIYVYVNKNKPCQMCLQTNKGLLPLGKNTPLFCADSSKCVKCKSDAAGKSYVECTDDKLT